MPQLAANLGEVDTNHELRLVLEKILERHYTYDMSKSMIIDAIIESREDLQKALA